MHAHLNIIGVKVECWLLLRRRLQSASEVWPWSAQQGDLLQTGGESAHGRPAESGIELF